MQPMRRTRRPGSAVRCLIWLVALLSPLAPVGLTHTHAAARGQAPRPNIVLIMADDMGFSDIGAYGGPIDTPNLDKLAANGLRFTQFYNAGRCCPTRASLLTGLYQHQVGLGHMTRDRGHPGYRGRLNRRALTLGEALKRAGYTTLAAGKWHVGGGEGQRPLDRGFDRFYGLPSGGGVYFKENFKTRPGVKVFLDDEPVDIPDDWHVTDALTDHALRFVGDAADRDAPFFLYLAHIAPHFPLQAPKQTIEKYRDRFSAGWDAQRRNRYRRLTESGIISEDWPLPPRDPEAEAWDDEPEATREKMALRMAVYAAMIDEMDRHIGRVVDRLEALGELDNTLILFLSDNGASAEGGPHGFNRTELPADQPGSYASYGLSWANASNAPFQRYKKWVHEGGIATPLIAHWPNGLRVEPGSLTGQVGHVIDLMPTFLELAGTEHPRRHDGRRLMPLEGRSLLPVFKGKRIGARTLFWEHEGNRAVRRGDWKLVAGHGEDWQLYNLAADRTELNDLAAEHPERVDKLSSMYERWAQRANVRPWPVEQKEQEQEADGDSDDSDSE